MSVRTQSFVNDTLVYAKSQHLRNYLSHCLLHHLTIRNIYVITRLEFSSEASNTQYINCLAVG